MEFLCGIANSLVGEIIKLTVEPVCRQVGYIFKYKSNIASLETEVKKLGDLRTKMQQESDMASSDFRIIPDNVENWKRDAENSIKNADIFLKNYEEHAKAKCSFRSFPNLVGRHGLSREAKKMAASIATLRADSPQDTIYSRKVPSSSDEVIEGYEAFESRKLIMNLIINELRNPEVRVVGLWGMGGIGKTMLAKEISRRARLDKMFEIDVMVTISNDPKPKDIQQHIAEKLGFSLHEKTVSARADTLRPRLRQEKKNILIILDDVWKKLDLQEIGVLFGTDQKGCKILVTSRFANVCDFIKAEKSTTFKLGDLNHSEARQLFNQNVGDSAREFDFENLANEIIKECAGLPIAIVVVASALKNGEEEVWKDVLRELKTSSPTNIEGMDKKVYSRIKVSYKRLANEEAKNLLLLCSLHAEDEDILIEDLIKYGMGLSWFQGITRLKDARNSVYHLVVKLKERSLLLDGKKEGCVKLHDVVRDACLSFASKDKCMHFIRDIAHFKEFIENEKLVEEATRISLPHEAINHLPQKLKWPHLELLLLRKGIPIVEIMDEQCFEEMKDLKVLNLSGIQVRQTCIFSSLQKLQTLCLRSCEMGDVAPIGELNKLKILDLSYSDFLNLPKEIGQLTQLQLLDLNHCSTLRNVESHVLSNLKNLEHLHMMSDFGKWGSNGNASLVELTDLDKLTTLYVSVPNVNSLPKFWLSNEMHLERYKISIGDWGYSIKDWEYKDFLTEVGKVLKFLELKLVKSHQVKSHGLEMLIGTAETLCLEGFGDLNDVFELDNKGFQHVEHFLFRCNKGARYFINPPYRCRAFLSLKLLVLDQMMNLEKICHGKLMSGSFGKLKKVRVSSCGRLKSLFSFSIARHFEQIKVEFCPEVQEIGTHENEHEQEIEQINDSMNESKSCELETLRLFNLPKLTQFFWPEQEINSMSDRGDGLFNGKFVFPKLREMVLSYIEVVKLWPDELHGDSFMQNLTRLKVTNCSGLNYFSSFDVAKSLELLESLELSDLEALKVVIVVKKQMDEVERMEKKLFPKLHTLELINLQNMDKFCSQCCFEFPSLKVLRIKKCPKVTYLDLIGKLSNLEVLDFSKSSFVELSRGIERLTQLKSLDLSGCEPLKVIHPDVISELIHLERLTQLKLFVPDFNFLPKDFFSKKWKECKITTNKGSYISASSYYYSSKLETKLKKREINVWECGLQVLLKSSKELVLDGLEDDMDDIVYELDKEGFPLLRRLTLKNNSGVRYLVNSVRHSSTAAFASLERLCLDNLTTLERICHGELIRGSFGKLTSVSVTKCARLKSLFPISVATQLEDLWVMDCEKMEAIITIEREVDNDLAFTELRSLYLENLPGLVQFCSKLKTTSTSRWKEEPSEEVLGISMPFFDAKVVFPKLRIMKLSGIKFEKLWPDELHEASFMQNLTTLKVTNCSGLNYLSSFDVAKSLKLLESLKLSDLEALKVVIVQMDEVKRMEKKLFPKLHTLELKNLQNMDKFCSQCCFEFPSLKVLKIEKCPKVADLDLIGKLSNLEVLDLSYSSFVELPRGIERLTQLKSLDLSHCKSLKVIQPNLISELIHLEELKMLESHVTWGAEGVSTGTKRSSTSISELINLPQMTVLKLFVPDFSFLPKDFFSKKWKECKITTNNGSYISFSTPDYFYSSELELFKLKKREINVWECGLQVLLKSSEYLVLDGLEDDMDC